MVFTALSFIENLIITINLDVVGENLVIYLKNCNALLSWNYITL